MATRIDMSDASVSRIERGGQPYNQGVLEAWAEAVGCSPADLLHHPPASHGYELWQVISRMPDEKRREALQIMNVLAG